MAARAQKLTATTITVLESAYVEENTVRLTCGTLAPRKFVQPKAVLEAIGGVWSTAKGAYVFPYGSDPAALIAAVLEAGTVPLAARTAEGYVRTPDGVATDILTWHVDVGHLPRGARVLEPSAGDGAIVRAILGENRDVTVVAVEPNPDRVAALRVLAATVPGRLEVHAMTLEEFAADPAAYGDPFDAVIMNPPFALPGNPDAWLSHVRTAYGLMYPGAQLAAIVPASYQYRAGNLHRDFQDQVAASCGKFVPLDRDAFAPSGCGVSAGVLTFPKPLPVPADGLPVWLARELPTGNPAPVREWNLGGSGAATMPVQCIGWDPISGESDKVIRYAGQCFGCVRLLWEYDNRGGAAVWEARTLDADERGKVGPAVLLCLECYCNGDPIHSRALAAVAPYWADKPADAPRVGPNVYPMDLGAGNWVTATGTDYRGHGWDRTVTGQLIEDPEIVESGPNYDQCAGKVALTVRLPADNTWSTVYVDPDTHVCVFDGPPAPEDAARAAIETAFADAGQARAELCELHSEGVDPAGRLGRALTVERKEAHAHTVATAHLPAIPAEPVSAPDPAPFVSGWTQEALPLPV